MRYIVNFLFRQKQSVKVSQSGNIPDFMFYFFKDVDDSPVENGLMWIILRNLKGDKRLEKVGEPDIIY